MAEVYGADIAPGVFLLLTYYMQQTLGYSPVVSGVAFLPLIAMWW